MICWSIQSDGGEVLFLLLLRHLSTLLLPLLSLDLLSQLLLLLIRLLTGYTQEQLLPLTQLLDLLVNGLSGGRGEKAEGLEHGLDVERDVELLLLFGLLLLLALLVFAFGLLVFLGLLGLEDLKTLLLLPL